MVFNVEEALVKILREVKLSQFQEACKQADLDEDEKKIVLDYLHHRRVS